MFKPAALLFVTISLSAGASNAQTQQTAPASRAADTTLPKCDQRKIQYSRFDEAYSIRVVWQDVSKSENPPSALKKDRSPQGIRWSVTVEPDRTKAGPWTTVIYFGSDANKEVWKLSLIDNIGTDFKWLSEKLVFGSIWWGRVYATEVILDVDSHKFIYREMAHYGDMIQPCE
jgi:hypothetical protein